MLIRTASFPRMTSQNDGSVNSEIPRLSPIHFRGLDEKSRLIETMQKRSSVVESIESAQDQVIILIRIKSLTSGCNFCPKLVSGSFICWRSAIGN